MPSFDFNEDFRVPFRNYVIDDLNTNTFIDNRFFGAQLATLNLDGLMFPIAVFFPEGGEVNNLGIIKKFRLVVRAYSNSHYDEAYEIHGAISRRLGGKDGPTTINKNIIIRPLTTPSETYEEEPRIYGVGSRFLVHWIS